MEKELPKNWVVTEIGKIACIVTGNTPSKNHSEYYGSEFPWVKPGDINTSDVIFYTTEYLTKEGFKKARKVPEGATMVTCIGNLGNVAMAGKDLATNQQINSIVLGHNYVNEKFVFYFSKTIKPWLVDNSTSTTISMVNKSRFEKAPIVLPPLPEQNRLVDKLDKLFEQLEVINAGLDKIPLLLKNFRQQVLTKAVTGKLTEEWRKGKNYKIKSLKLEDVCLSITDGDHQAPPRVEDGIPFLVISNVSKGYFDFENVSRFVPRKYYESLKESRIPRKEDILYTVTGSFGIPLLVDIEKEFCFQRHIAILRPNLNHIISSYLLILLKSNLGKNQAVAVAKGTAQMTVPLGGLRKFVFKVHALEEQKEIVNRVNILFEKADAIEKQYQILKEKIDNLPHSILHKAFKGELLPQLESDGDARDLLKEIEKLRKAVGTKTKNGKTKIKKYETGDEG